MPRQKLNLTLPEGKKIYFASDFHLGSPNPEKSLEREKKITKWLEDIRKDAHAIFLVGDIFDFWFEYKYVIPKGFIRFLGKIAELKDQGIHIYFFIGNHDVWMFDYFPKELGIPVYRDNIVITCNNKKIFIGHGDGYGPGDYFYKFLKKVFHNKFLQFCFQWVHPDAGIWFATVWSRHSRASKVGKEDDFLGDDEWLHQYSKEIEQTEHHDYYVFGHRHLEMNVEVGNNARYINIGEWFSAKSYGVFDGDKLNLLYFKEE